jgi:hypothetical protein
MIGDDEISLLAPFEMDNLCSLYKIGIVKSSWDETKKTPYENIE